MKIEVRKLQNTDIEELSRIEAASFSMPTLTRRFTCSHIVSIRLTLSTGSVFKNGG